MNDQILIREVEDGDVNFIYSTWLRSYKFSSPITESIRNDIFYPNHQRLLEKTLVDESTQIQLMVLKEDPRVILGFIVYRTPSLHFLYVKPTFRKQGMASLLLNSIGLPKDLKGIEYSHLTYSTIELGKAGKWIGTYNPYSFF